MKGVTNMAIQDRIKTLQQKLKEENLTGLLLQDRYAIGYYLDTHFDPMERLWLLWIPSEGNPHLIANKLFVFPEQENVEVTIVFDTDTVEKAWEMANILPDSEKKYRIGIDNDLMSKILMPLLHRYKQSDFILASSLVDRQRAQKTVQEEEALRLSSKINDKAMARMIEEVIPLGLSEVEAALRLETIYEEEGADGMSFEPIIAYGANGADPHHENDDTKPKIGDSVVIDIGCMKDGYASDMTRTVFYGELTDLNKEVYETVREAQQRGVEAAKVGATFADVDKAARDYIESKGYGPYFIHRTGHAIGRQVHEKGDVSQANPTLIDDSNAFSVEPGIYLPNQTAVRIEDVVLALKDGTEDLNHYPKDLIIVKPKKD